VILLPASEITEELPERVPAVLVEDLWVSFRTIHEKTQTLKSTLAQTMKRSTSSRKVDALRGVSFDVQRGSVFGVIGKNGAGKTTLFRTIAGILPPSRGRVTLWGHATPLLSLGLGFNRSLTGRENVLLGGLANGLSPADIAEHYHEIVEFADLGPAIDYPMRTYSSGMFGRLGFAIAAHLQPEILLVDEALSAGDASYKGRAAQKINDLCESEDCTVMLVSHGMEVVKMLASECLWIDKGEGVMQGPTADVVAAYLEAQGVVQANASAMDDF
jgi:ABC-type polysaccharide/polyol phosphate transport system ATPase subunit